jgi:hypothetical protein
MYGIGGCIQFEYVLKENLSFIRLKSLATVKICQRLAEPNAKAIG